MTKAKIAWLQYPSQGSFEANRSFYLQKVTASAKLGADVIFLPELFLWDYFPISEKIENFDLAIELDHPSLKAFKDIAAQFKCVIHLPIFEKRAPGIFHNTNLTIGTQGEVLDIYRKMHIPDDPSFYEKYYFAPGDLGFRVIQTPKLNIGVLICWDQWFPEAARLTAMKGADIIYYPTAIGWDEEEPEDCYEDQVDSWRTIIRSHAIANGVYTLAVNRVGQESHLKFWGNSLLTHPTGRVLNISGLEEGTQISEIETQDIENQRRAWPFFRDRRIENYDGLLERWYN